MVSLITGQSTLPPPPAEPDGSEAGDIVMAARGLSGGPLRDVHIELRRGEVLGIAGLLGSGRTEILKTMFGARSPGRGTVELDGSLLRLRHIGDAMAAGIAYVPEDRGEAAFTDLTLSENLSAAMVPRFWRRGWLQGRAADSHARGAIERFGIQAVSERQPMGTLSGGNQQKSVLARWLERHPRVLLLDEPTHGVDVGARAEIWALVDEAVAAGCSAVVVTSDVEELCAVAHRVLVLTGGRITAEVQRADLDPAHVTRLTFEQPGVNHQEVAS
jgi:ribose transport system ATP-binding protein